MVTFVPDFTTHSTTAKTAEISKTSTTTQHTTTALTSTNRK